MLIMDYILQMEKIIKYLEFNLELELMQDILSVKRDFNNDLNLLGCFIKDFLYLENDGRMTSDENLYRDFVFCFEKYLNKSHVSELIMKLKKYSKYYLALVFEDTKDRVLLTAIATINSCSMIEYYPFVMELMDEYQSQNIGKSHFILMLQLITDMVVSNFDKAVCQNVNLPLLRKQLKDICARKILERIAI